MNITSITTPVFHTRSYRCLVKYYTTIR